MHVEHAIAASAFQDADPPAARPHGHPKRHPQIQDFKATRFQINELLINYALAPRFCIQWALKKL